MGMTSAQSTAFKAASGNVEVSILHLVCIGVLLTFLFLWAAWHCPMYGPAGVTRKFGMLRWVALLSGPCSCWL